LVAASSVVAAADVMMATAPMISDMKRKSSRMRGFCGAAMREEAG
jgi:hypothetical protein